MHNLGFIVNIYTLSWDLYREVGVYTLNWDLQICLSTDEPRKINCRKERNNLQNVVGMMMWRGSTSGTKLNVDSILEYAKS